MLKVQMSMLKMPKTNIKERKIATRARGFEEILNIK